MPEPEPLPQSPRFTLDVPRHGIKALGQEVDSDFFVLANSLARGQWAGVSSGYESLHQQLCDDGVLVEAENGLRRFSTDYAFSSPSAAAAVVTGRSANGREQWKVEGSSQTYAGWQDQQVSAASLEPDEVKHGKME